MTDHNTDSSAAIETASLSKDVFASWPWDRKEEYLRAHPNSSFHYHKLAEKKGWKIGDPPKLGLDWDGHKKHRDPDHHRRHAKAHLIKAQYIEDQARNAEGKLSKKKKEEVIERIGQHKQWAAHHESLYHKYAEALLK